MFIPLHSYSSRILRHYNINHILFFEAEGMYTRITLVNGEYHNVKESVNDIDRLIHLTRAQS